jgi:polyisoprenoid-binding protein YceI
MAMKQTLLVLLALGACLGCDKQPEKPRRTEPWLASAAPSASAAPATQAVLELRFSQESSIRFSLPAKNAKPSGQLPVASGKLRLDTRDLKNSSANIDVDLMQIAIEPDSMPPNAELPGSPSASALNWLELGSEVAAERREQFALARFELTALENLSAAALDLDAKRPARVRATAVGTLLIHGFRAPVRAEVQLESLPPGPTGQLRVTIRSVSPLVLPLAPHEIAARGPSGVLDPQQSARAAGSVGKNARIELALVAESVVSR